jgi:hypothetical protein
MAPLPDANVVCFEVMTSRVVISLVTHGLAVMGFSIESIVRISISPTVVPVYIGDPPAEQAKNDQVGNTWYTKFHYSPKCVVLFCSPSARRCILPILMGSRNCSTVSSVQFPFPGPENFGAKTLAPIISEPEVVTTGRFERHIGAL